jgi:hypothetical protein
VVAHHAIAAQTHRKQLQAISQDFLKSQKIIVLAENPQTPVGAIERMINISP